ncbi:hypothetical protein ACFSQT_14250 [Mesorhizobium calcicola]|uniref:Uncharacterized protein n=1 Tax=Mesorhizobium calcicola TaxID=1300310 RepID=A0ABW4WEA9_9HYPH
MLEVDGEVYGRPRMCPDLLVAFPRKQTRLEGKLNAFVQAQSTMQGAQCVEGGFEAIAS